MDSQAPPNKLATGHDANKPSGGNALKTSARKRECGHCGNTLTNNLGANVCRVVTGWKRLCSGGSYPHGKPVSTPLKTIRYMYGMFKD